MSENERMSLLQASPHRHKSWQRGQRICATTSPQPQAETMREELHHTSKEAPSCELYILGFHRILDLVVLSYITSKYLPSTVIYQVQVKIPAYIPGPPLLHKLPEPKSQCQEFSEAATRRTGVRLAWPRPALAVCSISFSTSRWRPTFGRG